MVAQASENDGRRLKQIGVVGCWIRDRIFPFFAPLVARELQRQYAAVLGV
jgi:hypothetical protein